MRNKWRILFPILVCVVLFLTCCGRAEVSTTILTEPEQESTAEATAAMTTEPEAEPTTQLSTESDTLPVTQPVSEPSEEQGRDYVLNTNSKKFHFPDCSSAKQIKDSNREDFQGTRQELLDKGYSPCGRCKP